MKQDAKQIGTIDECQARRFVAKIKPDGKCFVWTGYKINGYGRFHVSEEVGRAMAHRWAWELWNGPIGPGLFLDHLCRNRSCVNPAHLEPVTNFVNVMRGEGFAAQNAGKLFCEKGHRLDRVWGGLRKCSQCQDEWQRKYRARKRAEYAARNESAIQADRERWQRDQLGRFGTKPGPFREHAETKEKETGK